MRSCIYGAGSLGTVLGAYITKNGGQIDLINRNRAHVEALRTKGAHVTGTTEMTVPVKALTPDEMTGKYDLIILLTKQIDNVETLIALKPYMSEDCTVCTLQNGLPEFSVAKVVGESATMGCTVAWGAQLVGPGTAELTSDPASMSFGLGRMNGVKDARLYEVKKLLELMCPVVIEEDFMGVRWSKLLINAAFSGMSVVTGGTFGEAAKNKKSRVYVQAIIKECIDVACATGVKLAPVQGKDITKLLDYQGRVKKRMAYAIIPLLIKKHRDIRASMLQDIEHGKKTEVDCINGAVCERGRDAGVPTPVNDKVVEIVHRIEAGELRPGFDNLRFFGV